MKSSIGKLKIIGASLFTALVFGSLGTITSAKNVFEANAWSGNQTSTVPVDYYSSCEGKEGSTLQSELLSINAPKSTSYDWSRYEAADEAEDDSNSILSVYTRHKISKSSHCGNYSWNTWNREHVWTQSKYPRSDTDNHNIFACEGQINNYRGSLPFAEVEHTTSNTKQIFGHNTDCYWTSSYFEPCDDAKGEIARSVMYGTVMYSYNMTDIAKNIETILKWHIEHPVTNRDIYRNNTVYALQGNRNPFVDEPSYACKIWGNTNSATRAICGNAATDTRTLTKITITSTDSSNYYVSEGYYISLKATATYSDESTEDVTNSVTWTSSNSSYATVDQTGKVTGVAGSATGQYVNINASLGPVSGTHNVYVWSNGEYGTKINTGSGDSSDTETVSSGEINASDLSNGTYETTDTLHTAASGIKFYTNYCAKFNGVMQFKKSTGYLYNAEAINLKSITINNPTDGTLSVFGGNSKSSITTPITGSNNVYNLTGYTFFKVMAGSTVSKCSSILVSSNDSGSTTPTDSLTIDKTSLSLDVGSTAVINATSSGTVTWKSSNTSVATVSANGTNNIKATVTGVAAGSAVITATCGTKSVTCNVTVTASSTPTEDNWPYENDTGYLMSFTSTSKNYFIGDTRSNYSYYGETTTIIDNAAIMYFEDNANEGHNLYCYRKSVKTYIQVVQSGTHINFDMTTTVPSTGWVYSDTYSTILFPVNNALYSIGSYSTYTTFSASTPDKTAYKAQFDVVASPEDFASHFLDTIKCSGSGSILFDSVDWNLMELAFDELITSAKNTLKNANANVNGTIIEQCVARYDAIVAKYSSYNDFMSRGVSNSSKSLSMVKDNSTLSTIVVISLVVAVTAISFVITKKKVGE